MNFHYWTSTGFTFSSSAVWRNCLPLTWGLERGYLSLVSVSLRVCLCVCDWCHCCVKAEKWRQKAIKKWLKHFHPVMLVLTCNACWLPFIFCFILLWKEMSMCYHFIRMTSPSDFLTLQKAQKPSSLTEIRDFNPVRWRAWRQLWFLWGVDRVTVV